MAVFNFFSCHRHIIFNISFELSAEQFRTMILYDWKIGLTYKDCHAHIVQAWGSNAPSHHTVFNCFREFQRNEFTVQETTRSGRPSTSVIEQTIDAVRKIIEDNPHSTYQQIEAILGINSMAINSIIHDYLNLRKVCGRWVPHTLTDNQKQFRVQFCRHSH